MSEDREVARVLMVNNLQSSIWAALENGPSYHEGCCGHRHLTNTSQLAGIAADEVLPHFKREGYAVIKVGDIPPWMEWAPNTHCECEWSGLNSECGIHDVEHYRMRLSPSTAEAES